MRRIPALITERYCVCAMTEPSPTTIHSLATPTTCRKSIRWGIGTRLGSASTLRRVISGRPRTRPQGGDEANVIKPGANYGWPIASYSREYSGIPVTETPWLEEFEAPEILWWPSIAPSGLTFYTGEHFPAWQGNLFVGAMRNRMPGRTGHLERIIFNRQGQENQAGMVTHGAQAKNPRRSTRQGRLSLCSDRGS